jgi:hypothetical protein
LRRLKQLLNSNDTPWSVSAVGFFVGRKEGANYGIKVTFLTVVTRNELLEGGIPAALPHL